MDISFLQSEKWEEFQNTLGKTTTRVDEQLLIKQPTPIGHYWYAPRPITNNELVDKFKNLSADSKAIFARVDPELESEVKASLFSQVPATLPQDTLIMPIQNPDAMMASFHSKTRYNIRLATKKGVTVKEFTTDPAGAEAFAALAHYTAERQSIRFFPAQYYKTMQKVLGGEPRLDTISLTVFVAFADNLPIAANIVLWDKQTVYYLHGASRYEARPLMAPHLLQWTAMDLAYERGFKNYDFWGIAPLQNNEPDPKHSWAGITRFKLGFGGEHIHYPDSFDIVTSSGKYQLYKFLRKVRRSVL